jgi:hypothetical protein
MTKKEVNEESSVQEYSKQQEKEQESISKPASWEYLLLSLAVISLLSSCVIISSKKYFWNDELFSYYMTAEPSFARMIAAFNDKLNNTPFLYFFLGWNWDKIFGSSELSLRLFSSLGICTALIAVWATVRRSFNAWPTIIGVLIIFCTSSVILIQNAEARMYGLFLALVAVACFLYDYLTRNPKAAASIILINIILQACIIHTHLYGFFYSGAILFSIVVVDRIYKTFRPLLYVSFAIAWATIVFYLPTFFIQADAGKPRTWIPKPDFRDLIDIYNISTNSFFSRFICVLFFAILAIIYLNARRINTRTILHTIKKHELSNIVLSASFLLVPLAIWAISLTVKPIFYNRYLIPSSIGWVLLFAFICSRMKVHAPIVVGSSYKKRGMLLLLTMLIIAYPIYNAVQFERAGFPGNYDMSPDLVKKYADLPRVVPFSSAFHQRMYYSAHKNKYFYILDWESAINKYSGNFLPQEYKHMEAWKRRFPEVFDKNVLTSDEFLQQYDRFIVLDAPDYLCKCEPDHRGLHTPDLWMKHLSCPQWVEMKLLANPNYKVTFLNRKNWFSVLLVEKQKMHVAIHP